MAQIFTLYEPPQGAPWWLPLAYILLFLFFLLLPVLLRYKVFERPSLGYALTLGPICGTFIHIFRNILIQINPYIGIEKAAVIGLCLLIVSCVYSCWILGRGYSDYRINKSKADETNKKLKDDQKQ